MRIPVCAADVNAERLDLELRRALGFMYLGLQRGPDEVTVHILDVPGAEESARLVISSHERAGLTPHQRAVVGLDREIAAQRKALGLSKAVPGLKAFQGMDAEQLARVVYLLWLRLEGDDLVGQGQEV